MMLGTDVSGLSTTAATAAAQGLSIVVPLYNEAAGLAPLHERLVMLQQRDIGGSVKPQTDRPHERAAAGATMASR